MSRAYSQHRPALRSLPGVMLLVLALLWAQLLGLAHGVLHAHVTHSSLAVGAQAQPAQDLLAHLLAPASDESECRLYDQLGQGGPLLPVLAAPALALPLVPAWVVLQSLQQRPCAAFAARAPPTSR
ncbi:MAG: hypothetical protein HYX45_02110 [Burkholderiales bacterium]|nr:hypothetical protein [Burkholderiales bacterium]